MGFVGRTLVAVGGVLLLTTPHDGKRFDLGMYPVGTVGSAAAGHPGTYIYHAWHPGGTILTGSASCDGDRPLEVRWP